MIPKFRAWDDARDEYFEVRGLSFPVSDNEKLGIVATAGDQSAYGPNMILEQYTGLKDANGNNIYEGDIIRMQRPGFHERACYEVKYFVQDVCIFQIVKVTDGSTLFESPSNGHDVEIVGNVHTNPELAEVQHD